MGVNPPGGGGGREACHAAVPGPEEEQADKKTAQSRAKRRGVRMAAVVTQRHWDFKVNRTHPFPLPGVKKP